MTGGEGFAKVMPAAFGFPWCLIYFLGLIKYSHLHINFKISEGIKSPWQRTTLLVSAITLHNIRRIGCWSSFGGVAAGIQEASIAGAVTLAIGLEFRIFRKELPCQCLCEEWNEQMEKFMWAISRIGRSLLQLF
jgi:ZIP family zinc transporter